MKRGILFVLAFLLALPLGAPAMAQEFRLEPIPDPDLKLGALPVTNIYPYAGYFMGHYSEAGSQSMLEVYLSAAELKEAVDEGIVQGFQADLITALLLMEAGVDLRVVRHIGMSSPPLFGLLTHPDSGIESAEDLRGARIGVSLNTINQYVTDLMLASADIGIDEVELVDVPNIMARGELLMAGELDAATIPQPLFTVSALQGASLLIDDSVVDYVPEVIAVTSEKLMENPDAVRVFLDAYEQYLLQLNQNETYEEAIDWLGGPPFLEYIGALAERVNHPVLHLWNLMVNTPIWPALDEARVPTEAEFAQVQDWALAAGLVSEARAYDEVIDGSYLPEMMADDDGASDDAADDGDGDE